MVWPAEAKIYLSRYHLKKKINFSSPPHIKILGPPLVEEDSIPKMGSKRRLLQIQNKSFKTIFKIAVLPKAQEITNSNEYGQTIGQMYKKVKTRQLRELNDMLNERDLT